MNKQQQWERDHDKRLTRAINRLGIVFFVGAAIIIWLLQSAQPSAHEIAREVARETVREMQYLQSLQPPPP